MPGKLMEVTDMSKAKSVLSVENTFIFSLDRNITPAYGVLDGHHVAALIFFLNFALKIITI